MAGRAEVREAVTAFLANADLQYVGKVHAARPNPLQEQDYEENRMGEAVASSAGSSAVLVVGIPGDTRQRRADTGRGAVNDSWIYEVGVEVYFASVGGDAVRAQEDYDVVIDGITNLIRSNATLESPTTIWSAGEYESGIRHQQAQPYTGSDGLVVMIPGVVHFQVWQWVAGNV